MGWPKISNKDADKIDAFLGDGAYDQVNSLDSAGRAQLARAAKLDKILLNWDDSLLVLSPYGTEWVEKLHNDLTSGLDLILESKFPDPTPFRQLYDIYPLAMDAADLQMDEAEAIPYAALLTGVASLTSIGFANAAGQLRDDLLELEDMLREAQADEVETEIKSALGFVITSVELLVPGLGLVAKGGLTAGEIIMDYDNPTKLVQQATKIGLESVEEIKNVSDRVKHITKRGGKLVTVSGFYFDAAEVFSARKNVREIKNLLDKAQKEYKELMQKYGGAIKSLVTFQSHIENMMRPIRTKIWAKWRERDMMIQKYGYSLDKPIQWKISADADLSHTVWAR